MKQKRKFGAGRPPATWTEEKKKKLEALYPIMDNEAIAKALDVTPSAVHNAAFYYGFKKDRAWRKDEEAIVLRDWPTESAADIGKKIGRSRWAVINKYRELKKEQ